MKRSLLGIALIGLLAGCGGGLKIKADPSPAPPAQTTPVYGDGTYAIGVQILPGDYSTTDMQPCLVSIDDNKATPGYRITLTPGEHTFAVSGGCNWIADPSFRS